LAKSLRVFDTGTHCAVVSARQKFQGAEAAQAAAVAAAAVAASRSSIFLCFDPSFGLLFLSPTNALPVRLPKPPCTSLP
jgi:hypothetical protein